MAHIAIITSGSIGFLNASFEMMSRLKKEGHEITCLSCLDVKARVEEQGFPYMQLPEINFYPVLKDPEGREANGWKAKLKLHLKGSGYLKEQGRKLLGLDEFKSSLQKLSPDFALVNMELHEAIFTLMELQIPFKLLSSWYNFYRIKGLPPIRQLIIPGNEFDGSTLGIARGWAFVKAKIYGRYLFDILQFRNYRRILLKQYAREIGYPKSNLILRNFPSVFIHKKLPILTMTLKELEFPHRFPDRFTYLGPMVFEARQDKVSEETHQRLKHVFNLKKTKGLKLVYCSVSSNKKADANFLKNVVEAVRGAKDWVLVMTTGGKMPESFSQDLPENVYVFKWLPQLQVLSEADCSINHGGGHAISECIHFSVPMLIFSGGEYDQNGCAARISYHGLGILGDTNQDDASSINQKIEEILQNKAYKEKMRQMNGLYLDYKSKALTPLIFSD
ncbi:MAG: nucleotide disphospho-sugar-binding domain-containing protein [Bacteroidota bacterium]